MRLCRLRLGLAASRLNICETVAHSWDPSFEPPAVSLGPAIHELPPLPGIHPVRRGGDAPRLV